MARLKDRLALAATGTSVDTHVSTLCTDPWTFVVGAQTEGDPT